MKIDMPRVCAIGVLAWAIALAVTLLVPSLHSDDRTWWPWSCVCGIALGLLGWAYVRRGRGNASAA